MDRVIQVRLADRFFNICIRYILWKNVYAKIDPAGFGPFANPPLIGEIALLFSDANNTEQRRMPGIFHGISLSACLGCYRSCDFFA